jgi:hypothetical protein
MTPSAIIQSICVDVDMIFGLFVLQYGVSYLGIRQLQSHDQEHSVCCAGQADPGAGVSSRQEKSLTPSSTLLFRSASLSRVERAGLC